MKMQKPTFEQFGINEDVFGRFQHFHNHTVPRLVGYTVAAGGLGGVLYAVVIGGFSLVTPIAMLMFGALGSAFAFFPSFAFYMAWPIFAGLFSPAARGYRHYIRAREKYDQWELRTRTEYWRSLSGRRFEHELGNAFRREGYEVTITPASGDKGIDLILRRNGRTTIVQCKATVKPIGPAVARELYGTLLASGADEAILATTSGVTGGVREFISGKPIKVMNMSDILKLHQGHIIQLVE